MEVLNPGIGSNQFVTKFDKESKKAKVKKSKITKNRIIIGMFVVLVITGYAGYRMFVSNYHLQRPWARNNGQELYTQIWNDRAMCLTDIQQYDKTYKLMSDR